MSETRRTLSLIEACALAGIPEPRYVAGSVFTCHYLVENDDEVWISQGGPKFCQREFMAEILGLSYDERFNELSVSTTATMPAGTDTLRRVVFDLGKKKWRVEIEPLRAEHDELLEYDAEVALHD